MRGLNIKEKRKEIFYSLRDKAEIICLQETHSTLEVEKEWSSQWGKGRTIFSHGTSRARGVLLHVKDCSGIQVKESIVDEHGRFLIVQIESEGVKFCIVVIYAPNDDQPDFFSTVFRKSETMEGHRIVLGDFNLVLNPELDRSTKKCNNNAATDYVLEYIESNNLADIWRLRNPNRKHYSWRRKNPNKVASRLDIILVDLAIASWFKYVSMKQSHRTDHLLVEGKIDILQTQRGPGLWRFNTRHLTNPEFIRLMNEQLTEQILVGQERQLNPNQLWEHVKLTLAYNAQMFSRKIARETNLIQTQLQDKIELMLQDQEHLTEGDEVILERSIQDLEEFKSKKAQGAIFRSKVRWYNEGEKNSKYFFALERSKSGAKNVSVLIDKNNREITKPKEILEEMGTFYQNLYSSDSTVKFTEINEHNVMINEEEKNSLEGLISMSELNTAVKNLNRDKAPGTDGLPVEIYVMFWTKIREFLLKALNYSYECGLLNPSALEGVISLIPKPGKDTRFIKNLRPITLLNTDYKILEKCLANRLKPVLNSIINEDQKGFMAERSIGNNIRRILDAVIYCEEKDLPITIVSIDAEKAFDRIEIDSLIGAMKYFGIGESFQKWTRLCFTQAKARVINHGYLSSRFPVTRGVKQGGCCSAFYFLLLIETLANKLRNANLTGMDIGNVTKLLGQYADDLDLYLWGDRQNIKSAIQVIRNFEKSSGMRINTNKSTILKIGNSKDLNLDLDIKQVSQINVLGVDVLNSKDEDTLLQINYDKVIERASSVLNQWRARGLSLLGKILIINTLVSSLFVYKMSVLPPIPEKYVKKLNTLMNQFLWNMRKPKIPIEILQIPKKYGGAGLVNFEMKDAALKIKWVKDILSDTFIAELAYKQINSDLREKIWICNLNYEDVRKLNISNKFWDGVLKAWCRLNYIKHVPPDESPHQFLWYNSHITQNKTPYLDKILYRNGIEYLFQLQDDKGKMRTAHDIANEFKVPVFQVNCLLASIPQEWRKGDKMADPDSTINHWERITVMSKPTAYAYKQLVGEHGAIGHVRQKWCNIFNTDDIELECIETAFKNIYKCTNYTKLRSFQYRLLHNALVFNRQLYHWKIKNTDLCSNCNKEKETVLHFYCECEYAQKLWSEVQTFIYKRTGEQITLTSQNIIFGNLSPTNPVANIIVLATKSLLYSYRCSNKVCTIKNIRNYIYECENLERFNAIKKGKLYYHNKKWGTSDEIEQYLVQGN